MIVSVCGDKGAPGVSTLATVLTLVWPGERVLLEADTAGSDLSFRLRPAGSGGVLGGHLAPDPSIAASATAARLGLTAEGPLPYAQSTSLGIHAVPGVLSSERFRALGSLWQRVAGELCAWSGTVIADLGRLHLGGAAMSLARASTVVIVLTTANLEGLYHVRDQVAELSGATGDPTRDRPSVGVVVTGEVRDQRSSFEQVRQVLASIGSPAPVVGFIARDPAGARGLWAGELNRRLAGSELVRSARRTAELVLATWPALTPATSPDPAPAGDLRDGVDPATQDSAGPVMEETRT